MRAFHLLLVPVLLLLLSLPYSRGRYNDDFDDGEDIADFDDNDFAEFEDMNEDGTAETETAPPPRASPSSSLPEEEEDEDEATVELEEEQDGFEESDNNVSLRGARASQCQSVLGWGATRGAGFGLLASTY